MNIAYRVDIQTHETKGELILRNMNRHTWEVDDKFTYGGREWTVDAVLLQWMDGVPYPAEKLCLLIAGDRETRSSLVINSDRVELVESE